MPQSEKKVSKSAFDQYTFINNADELGAEPLYGQEDLYGTEEYTYGSKNDEGAV